MNRRRSLTRRVLVTVLLLEMISALALIGAGVVHEWRSHVAAFDVMLRGQADTLLGAVADAEDSGDDVMLDRNGLAIPSSDVYSVEDEHGRVLGQSSIVIPADVLARATASSRPENASLSGHAYRLIRITGIRFVDPGDTNGGVKHTITVIYGARTGHIRHEVFEAVRFYATTTLLLLILTSIVIVWMLRRDLAPLHELAREAERISGRNWKFNAPADAEQTAELAPLARALEAALARLQHSYEQQRRFTSDAAHELKTDVAIAKSSLQLLTMRSRSAEDYRRGLELCLDDCTRLERTVREMLTLARVEHGSPDSPANTKSASSSMWTCLQASVRQATIFAELRRVTLEVETSGAPRVGVDARDCELMCLNLLLNAVEHSPEGAKVRVSLNQYNDQAALLITDEGEGIAVMDLPHIFEPFYRGDPSRSRKSGGTGLGLAICKAICERAGGAITVRNRSPHGAEALVTLPLHSYTDAAPAASASLNPMLQ